MELWAIIADVKLSHTVKSLPGFAFTALAVSIFMAAIVIWMLSQCPKEPGRTRRIAMAMIATVMGMGVWTTHFVAMLGFRSDFLLSYDPVLTLLSAAVGVALVGGPIAATVLVRRPWQKALLGAAAGGGVGAMHFVGMSALQGCLTTHDPAVTALALSGGIFAYAAAATIAERRSPWSRVGGGALLVLGVCFLHFTAMAGATFEYAPSLRLWTVDPIALSALVAIASLILSAAAFVAMAVAARLDAHKRAATESELRQHTILSTALQNMTNGLVMFGPDGLISLFNERAREMLRLDSGGIAIGMPLADLVGNVSRRNGWDEEKTSSILASRHGTLSSGQASRVEQEYADGTVLSIAFRPMTGGGSVLTYDDLTEQRAAREKIEYMAYHDALTGLPNRRYLAEKLGAIVAAAQGHATRREVALFHIDLDGFKQINDFLGHATGDKVLCYVAGVLRGAVRKNDIAVRVGGDEFAIFCETGTELAGLTGMARRIIEDLSKPVTIDGEVCRFGASIGIARERLDGIAWDVLMSRADVALYDAKRSGRGRVSIFTETMKEEAVKASRLRDEIQHGIEAGEFRAVYHPQFDARTMDIVGLEALARWDHPDRGILAPDSFRTIAEDLGIIDAIDDAILACAVHDRARGIEDGYAVPRISVNVSARRLRSSGLVELVRGLGLPRGAIAFELLASIDLDDPDAVTTLNIDGLRDLGVGIEIDDFGAGRTSILSLVRLKPDRLKIDRQIVEPIIRSDAALNLVASIIEIGRSLGIGVTAEGVETLAHAEKLRWLGCDVLQGFAFCEPMTGDALLQFLSAQGLRAA